jgi:hypothetical protein
MWNIVTLAIGTLKAFFGWREKVAEQEHDNAEQTAGRAEEKAATQDAALQEIGKAHDVANKTDSLSDAAVDDGLSKWTKPPPARPSNG